MEKHRRKSGRKHKEESVCKEEICKYIWSYQKDCVILHATNKTGYDKAIIYNNINSITVFLFESCISSNAEMIFFQELENLRNFDWRSIVIFFRI